MLSRDESTALPGEHRHGLKTMLTSVFGGSSAKYTPLTNLENSSGSSSYGMFRLTRVVRGSDLPLR